MAYGFNDDKSKSEIRVDAVYLSENVEIEANGASYLSFPFDKSLSWFESNVLGIIEIRISTPGDNPFSYNKVAICGFAGKVRTGSYDSGTSELVVNVRNMTSQRITIRGGDGNSSVRYSYLDE